MNNEIPESAARTVKRLREMGHETFLCTGRSRAFIYDENLLSLDFSGIISGCGTMIEYHGDTVFYKRLQNRDVERMLVILREHGFRPVLEGREYLYLDWEDFSGTFYGEKLRREMGDKLHSIQEDWGRWEISKLSCATENARRQECFDRLGDEYDFLIHDENVCEMVPKGFDKATGIQKVCELLDIGIEDTYAFGDSVNDLGMFRVVGKAIAMGNGSKAAKEAADYVTSPMFEDGIWNGCQHFGLLG